jgi:hypothetical protein
MKKGYGCTDSRATSSSETLMKESLLSALNALATAALFFVVLVARSSVSM